MRNPPKRLEVTVRGRVLLLLIGLVLGAALLTGDRHLHLAASILIAPMLIDWLLKARRLDATVARVAPRRTEAGSRFDERLVLERPPGAGTTIDTVVSEPAIMGLTRGRGLVRALHPGRPTEVRLLCCSRTRSHLLEREFVLESTFPFGFLKSRGVLTVETDFVTEPARIPLPDHVLRSAQHGEPEPRQSDFLGGGDFHSLREYRPDEDARTVHALRSAALGTLVRKVIRGNSPKDVVIVLDLRRQPGKRLHTGRKRFEYGLRACASLLDFLEARNVTMHTWVLAEHERCQVLRGHDEVEDFLTFLSEVEPASGSVAADRTLALTEAERYFWIPAGGHVASEEIEQLGDRVVVLDMEVR